MKRVPILCTTVLLVLSGPVLAQSVAVELNPAQRTHIKETLQKMTPAQVNQQPLLGSTVPTGIELRPVPRDWAGSVARYRYLYADNRVFFVDPSTRKIVRIVE